MILGLLMSLLLAQGPVPRLDGGTVTGLVRFADGRAADSVRVAAMFVPDIATEPTALAVISRTDGAGRYRLEGVPPGRYYIVAGRVDLPTYYPAGTDISAARPIAVTSGATIDGIDLIINELSAAPVPPGYGRFLPNIVIPTAKLEQVKGRIVMDESSKEAKMPESIVLNVRQQGGRIIYREGTRSVSAWPSNTTVGVAADGTFSVSLQSGDGTISISGLPEGYSVKSVTSGTTNLLLQPLNVQAGIPDIVIVLTADLRPRFKIAGHITDASAGQLFGEQVELVSESGSTTRLLVDLEGRFLFLKVQPGKYVLRLASSKVKVTEQQITITDRDLSVELRAEVP